MAVQQNRKTRSKRDMRRSHDALPGPTLSVEPVSGETHRRHHADPWNLKWVFIPRHVHFWTVPQVALILWLLWPWKELALTGVAAYLLLGLHYEWVHFLSHIPWCPSGPVVVRASW